MIPGFRFRRTHIAAWFAFALALVLAGCSLFSHDAMFEATVALREYSVDVNGAVTDSTDDPSPEGVPGWLVRDSVVVAGGLTRSGRLEMIAAPGTYRLLVGPTPLAADTLGPVVLGRSAHVKWPATVLLRPAGLLVARPNPSAGALEFEFTLGETVHALLCVRAMDGTIVRTLSDRTFIGGRYAYTWDRTNDAGQAVPAGRYWVTLEHFPPAAVQAAVRPGAAPGSPIPVPPPSGSPRRGERTSVTLH